MVRSKLTIFVTLLLLFFSYNSPAKANEPIITGETAALIDLQTGELLYGKEPHKKMYPASTTKTLTALVALQHADLKDMVTVGPNASKAGGTSIWLADGERLTMEELLFALMLNSANDAGVAIAEHISGSVERFADLCNLEAKRLGAMGTHFTNPHGMPDENHYSTAYDLALIGRKAMESEDFRRIITTVNHEIPRADPEAQKYLHNHNKLLTTKTYGYKGANGIKTGYTVQAGQCIIASAQRDGRELIAVVLRSEGSNLWTDAKSLLDYGFNNFENQQLVNSGKVLTSVPVKYGKGEVSLAAGSDFVHTFKLAEPRDFNVSLKVAEDITAPVDKGEILGKAIITINGQDTAEIDLVAAGSVERHWPSLLKGSLYWVVPLGLFLIWFRWRVSVYRRKQRRIARLKKYFENSLEDDIDTR